MFVISLIPIKLLLAEELKTLHKTIKKVEEETGENEKTTIEKEMPKVNNPLLKELQDFEANPLPEEEEFVPYSPKQTEEMEEE